MARERREAVGTAARAALLSLGAALFAQAGCYYIGSRFETTVPPVDERALDPADVALPEGFDIEIVAAGLTWPAGITFDERGTPYVVESGFSYDWQWDTPRLLRIEPDGDTTVIAVGDEAPWLGVDYANGAFFVAEGGLVHGGKILRVERDGTKRVLVSGLPGHGDHHTNGPVVGPDGWVYFAQGTATNSGVVGIDNYDYGWLQRRPDYHDIPCRDIALLGRNYRTENPLTPQADDVAVTGAYQPFGVASEPGQIVEGRVPCTGAVMRVPAEGGEVELVAWGLRNPFGLAFSPEGKLYVTDNGYDERGSRPVFGSADWLWAVDPARPGLWYGWPDFAGGRPVYDARYDRAFMKGPDRLLAEHPNEPPLAKAFFGVHASADGIDVARTGTFAPVGTVFVAEFGDMSPAVGRLLSPVGFRVVTVDPETGVITPFVANRGERSGPASRLGSGGLERPVDVALTPAGDALYIVDFGVMTMSEKEGPQGSEPRPQKGTGVIWRVTRAGAEVAAARR